MSKWESLIPQGCPDEIHQLRTRALANFESHGFPGKTVEDWKYTPLTAVNDWEFVPAQSSRIPDKDVGLIDAQIKLVFVDGLFNADLSSLDEIPEGVSLTDISIASSEQRFEVLAGTENADQAHSLCSLNTALSRHGAILKIGEDVQLNKPIEIIYWFSGEQTDMSHIRNLIVLEKNAQAILVESYEGGGESLQFSNVVTQIKLADHARLKQLRVQTTGVKMHLVTRTVVSQSASSHYSYHGLDTGGLLVRHDIDVNLDGVESEANLFAVYMLNHNQHVDNHSVINHKACNTHSREVFKGVLGGKSRAVFNGKVVVHKGADGSEAHQSNANILMSKFAEVDTKPELEIYADEVVCSHGATVGQLDDAALFYLQTRGIKKEEARRMLTVAFCREVLDYVGDEQLTALQVPELEAAIPEI
ncbi:MAG: Fe-S cluster assembly protein SufD [bacterium]